MAIDKDFLLESYNYDLPAGSVAQFPCQKPGTSRLMVFNRADGTLRHTSFTELASYLPANALLVANNTAVLPARITGRRASGGKLEFLLLTPLPLLLQNAEKQQKDFEYSCQAECLLRPVAKLHNGDIINLSNDLQIEIIKKETFGKCQINLRWQGNLEKIFMRIGKIPLPPYIQREAEVSDQTRYQTIYAKKTGSVAAPTAGLHFTPEIKAELETRGFQWAEISLYVGYGTFSPVRCADIRQHGMHSELVEISGETAQAIEQAKKDKRPIVAVGTTSLRAIEGAYVLNKKIAPFYGWIDLFLYPGASFNVVNNLITNFHLPQSSLLMLVSAFAGREAILDAYAQAVKQDYKFFSYGDAMLIL